MSGHDREEIILGGLEIMGRKEIGQLMKKNMDTGRDGEAGRIEEYSYSSIYKRSLRWITSE